MYLYGASGHAKVIVDVVTSCGQSVKAIVDDDTNKTSLHEIPVIHESEGLSPFIVSIGSNRIRKQIVDKLKGRMHVEFATAIHPSAIVSSSAQIGEGTVVMAGAVINADAVIGKHCIINTGASVDHECRVEDFCHIAPHATLCGQVHVGAGTIMGVGSCAIPCVDIGSWCTIGAGAVVINNIEDTMKVVGVPAMPMAPKLGWQVAVNQEYTLPKKSLNYAA